MNFAFNADQDLLRDSVVRLLRDKVDLGRLTGGGNRVDTSYDPTLWREMTELGWPGLIIPETFGGLAMSLVDWIVITEEVGRSLAPCPYLGNYAGTLAVMAAGSPAQQNELLPAVVDGAAQLALAWSEHESNEDPRAVESTVASGRLSGTKRYVLDADTATHFVVTATDRVGRIGFHVVARDQPGVEVEVLPWMDVTRRVCTIAFSNAQSEPMASDFDSHWQWIVDRILLALSSENAGGAEAILHKTVAYAKERVQFGKPIASFQAIKHKCADMLMKVESAKALSYYAAWALAQENEAAPLAAAMAKSFSSDAYRFCTAEAIQIHGAIGFTWEMPVHLYYKRARANAVQFGAPAKLRDRVIELVTAA
jgi:alkylation response protein AidB-like acyl-CoA dehydrogenase